VNGAISGYQKMQSRCRNASTNEAKIMSAIFAFIKNESGATAIEYALIAAGISVVIIAAVRGIGTTLNSTFSNVSSSLK
jgi:pilus assembly protein Flp/PilA